LTISHWFVKILTFVKQNKFVAEEFEPIFTWRSPLTQQSDIIGMMQIG
jgi:hypothetical protein